jgi:hypothetical protein
MPSDDDKRCANRLRANADKLILLSYEFETLALRFGASSDSDSTRREHLRRALEHTRNELLEMMEILIP